MLQVVSEILAQLFISVDRRERTPSWLGGVVVFGSMAVMIVALWLLGRS